MPTVGDLISEAGQMPDGAIRLPVESSLPDHIHLLVEVDPQHGAHELVKAVKARSSRVLREEFPWLKPRLQSLWAELLFRWHPGWGFVVGDGTVCRVAKDR